MTDVRDTLLGDAGYPVAIIVHTLRGLWVRFSRLEYAVSATRFMVGQLIEETTTGQEAHELAAKLRAFVDEHEKKISIVLSDSDVPLTRQPESLLVFFMIEHGQNQFAERWASMDVPWATGQEMATIWGKDIRPPARPVSR